MMTSKPSHPVQRLTGALRRFARQERGAGTAFFVLGTMALLVSAAFIVDTSTSTGDAAQIKRATDAAALAVGRQAVLSAQQNNDSDEETLTELAFDYVKANLGINSALAEQLTLDKVSVSTGRSNDDYQTYTVTASFTTTPRLLQLGSREQQIYSTAEVVTRSTEVSLVLPNTLSENSSNLAVLRRLGNEFAENLIADKENVWLALVPYSQTVNVYDASATNRIRQWAETSALNPVELTTLFMSGYGSLADRRMPDQRAKLLCMYRGLDRGDNYFWDQAPGGAFKVSYLEDIPSNDSDYGIEPYAITWVGPNPEFGQATGANDTRTLITQRGCPSAALLPLTNDLDKISDRLDAMSRRFNTNYAIAVGWAAMALAPAFRGESGWGLDDSLPKDFDKGNGERLKAIVLLANSTGQRWFDTDAYNAYVGKSIDGCPSTGTACNGTSDSLVTERFANLCTSFKKHNIKFYLIVTGNDEASDEDGQIDSASAFRRLVGAGLQICAEKSSDLTYYNGADFVATEGKIRDRLNDIVDELHQKSGFVRLIE